jgi:hypothetical protein
MDRVSHDTQSLPCSADVASTVASRIFSEQIPADYMDINKIYMAVFGKISKEFLAVGNYRASGPPIYSILYKYKNIWWPTPLFLIFISQIGIETSTFISVVGKSRPST